MYKEILLCIDLNDPASQEKALATAIECARNFGSRLHVMTVIPDFGMSIVGSFFPEGFEKKALDEGSAKLHDYVKKSIPEEIDVQHIVGHGTIYEEILRVAEEQNVDLIIMASHRPELKDYLLGPNAARVVRHANCSVLVVRENR